MGPIVSAHGMMSIGRRRKTTPLFGRPIRRGPSCPATMAGNTIPRR